jgi:hypothetical protein
MSVKRRTEPVKEISVNGNEEVKLSVIIGNGHIGSSAVKFRYTSDTIAQGEISNLLIGKGSAIIGRTLRVATRVLIASPTNKIIIRHSFDNGLPADSVYMDEVSDNNDVYTLVADYLFTS